MTDNSKLPSGLIALEIASRIHKVDFDSRAVAREFAIGGEELSKETLLRIAKAKGFRARFKRISIPDIKGKYPFPVIATGQNGSFFLVLGVNEEKNEALIYEPGKNGTQNTGYADLDVLYGGEVLVLAHRGASSHTVFGLKWFYTEILRYKSLMLEVLLGSFVVQLFGFATPLFTQIVLDKVVVRQSLTTLNTMALAFVIVVVFEFLFNLSRKYLFIHTASKLDARLGAKLFKKLFTLPFVYFEVRKVGTITARVRELDTIREFITNKSVSVLIDLFFSFVFVIMMVIYSVKLTLIVCGFVAAISLLYFFITPELRRRLEERFLMGAASNSYLVESITGIQTVKSLSIEGSMQKKWESILGDYIHSSFRLSNMTNVTSALTGIFQRLMTLTVLYFGVGLVITQKLSMGQLIAFHMFSGQFSGPVIRLVNLWNEFQQALLSVNRLGDILNHPSELETSTAITLPRLQGAVRFDDVSFAYRPGLPHVLNNFNLSVNPGMCVGIVGQSGSGKSTITKLIQRLYIAGGGAVYVDNIDVRHLNPFWLRYNIGVVLQEDYLFSGTIRENITLPMPDATMELVIQAATLAGAHSFISLLPEGYDTVVGERGTSLSGGQKQRIAIARALITNPKLLIFDEATSALDMESEMIIRKNLDRIKTGRTLFLISHKLATVRDCDLIIAIDKGQIAEMGTHNDLLKQNGYYARLVALQKEQW